MGARFAVRHSIGGTRDDRGAVAAIMASTVVVLVLVASFAVDLGVQRVARRDMQSLADVVALDVGRLVNGRTTSQIKAGQTTPFTLRSLSETLNRSVARNLPSTLGSKPSNCAASGGTVSTVGDACVRAYLVALNSDGTYPTGAGGVPQEQTANLAPTGVVVMARTAVGFAFGGIAGIAGGGAERLSVVGTRATACFAMGSFLARVQVAGGGSAGGEAGTTVNTPVASINAYVNAALGLNAAGGATLLGYNGLANASFSVNQLATALGVGSPTELATTSVTVGQFLQATAMALSQNGDAANAQVVSAIINHTTTSALNTQVLIGNLISLDNNPGAALNTQLNAFSLITSGVLLASGGNLASVPTGISIGGNQVTSKLTLIKPAQTGCGGVGAVAMTEQVDLVLSGQMASPASAIGLPGTVAGVTLTSPGAYSYRTSVAQATGTITAISCGQYSVPAPDGLVVSVTPKGAVIVASVPIKLEFNVELRSLGVLVANVNVKVTADATASTATTAAGAPLDLHLPPNDVSPLSTSANATGLKDATIAVTKTGATVTAKLAGLGVILDAAQTVVIDGLITSALNAAKPTVNGLIGSLDGVLATLNTTLGLNTAGADVFGIKRPNCASPALRG